MVELHLHIKIHLDYFPGRLGNQHVLHFEFAGGKSCGSWIGLDWNALFCVDKIVKKKK